MRARVVVGIASAVLLASGVAFAATDGGSRPTVTQDEVTTSTTVGSDSTSTSVDDSSTSTTATAEAPTSTTVSPNGSTTTTEHEGEQPENHGACVSAAAHNTPPGPDHGKAVSEVAHSDCGKTSPSTTATTAADN